MDWKLETMIIPVSDVDRARAFYVDRVGFTLDVDHRAGDAFRVVQMTPPGSACSITIGTGLGGPASTPGAYHGMHLVVPDIEAARAHLVARGVEAEEIHHFEGGGRVPGPAPGRGRYESFTSFPDPDGNTWVVQEA